MRKLAFPLATVTNKEISQINEEARQHEKGDKIRFGSIYR